MNGTCTGLLSNGRSRSSGSKTRSGTWAWTRRFFTDFAENFGKLYDKLPKQLVHRNPHPGNILFENGEVSGIIGFDLSEINIRLWDPIYCATGIMSETGEENHEKWAEHPRRHSARLRPGSASDAGGEAKHILCPLRR